MASSFTYTDRVQFADTDMAGIMHFANFFRFLERAEHAFFRSLDLSVVERNSGLPREEQVGWPRVHASCDYHAPLRFEDVITIEMFMEDVRTKSLRYLFRVYKEDGTLSAEGRMAVVCVRKDQVTGQMKAVEIPERIHSKLEVASPESLKRKPNAS
jgi:acyl-CoA thioester hydrolase